MKIGREITLTLDNFEGPLELLFHLVHKCEIDIYEVALKEITDQFFLLLKERQAPIDKSAEFIATAASLIWFKSQQLLPKQEVLAAPEELMEDPHFEIIHHLIDYCRFKHAAKELVERENEQKAYHPRGTEEAPKAKKNLGIEHLTLDDLAGLFQKIASKAKQECGQVSEERWKVSDKITSLRRLLLLQSEVAFEELFSSDRSRLELIVIFLAVLELMKLTEILVAKELSTNRIVIIRQKLDIESA